MLWEVMAIAVALGCDAFAVGLGVGTRCGSPRQVFRLSFHFGLFQFLMPLAGWGLGQYLLGFIQLWAPWLAFAVLGFIGGKMIWEGLHPDEAAPDLDPTRGWSLVGLSVATSLDAMGVGLSFALVGREVLWPAVVIGLVAAGMTLAAMKLGSRLSRRFGRVMGVIGGLVLMAIALKLLLG